MNERNNSIFDAPLAQYSMKLAIFFIFLIIFISAVTPDLPGLIRSMKVVVNQTLSQQIDKERARVLLLSFINNPEALWIDSEFYEKENYIDKAIQDMRLAVGLLEMHNADKSVIKKYQDRIASLQQRKN